MVALALSIMAGVAVAQSDMGMGKVVKKDGSASAPLKTVKDTVKSEGDKVTLVSDSDKKSWDVVNPEALKGHEGHHVKVSAHVYADKN